jgi:hypothetical protein
MTNLDTIKNAKPIEHRRIDPIRFSPPVFA